MTESHTEVRNIKMGFPSGTLYMKFIDGYYHVIIGMKSEKPYIKVWKRKYYLTAEEIKSAKTLLALI